MKNLGKARIYLSGAITGCDDYIQHFEAAEKQLTGEGFSVINPARILDQLPKDTTKYEEYMELSMNLLDMCDFICMLEGWEQSRGANREYGYALGMDKTIIKESLLKIEKIKK